MSKRKHKNKEGKVEENKSNFNNINNNPFGINPNQLLSMFGNIDMNQINGILSAMNSEGFDFNNFNLNSIQNLVSGMNKGNNSTQGNYNQNNNYYNQTNNEVNNKVVNDYDNNLNDEILDENDENIQMLLSLKKIVNTERGIFIDKVLKHYKDGGFKDL